MRALEQSLGKCADLKGFLGACIANLEDGQVVCEKDGDGGLDLQKAGVGVCRVLQAKLAQLNEDESSTPLEDILISLETQHYLIRPLPQKDGLFVFLALDRASGNLAMARFLLADVERAVGQ